MSPSRCPAPCLGKKVKEIYKLGLKHGVQLSAMRGPHGLITDATIQACRTAALARIAGRDGVLASA